MILELDVGNTRAKWRILTQAGVICSRGQGDPTRWFAGQLPAEWQVEIRRVRVASVRDEEILDQLSELFLRRCGVRAEVARVSEQCGGVRNGYLAPETLGVDRWLAMVAAFVEFGGPILVVDVGSALTIDLVDGQGQHLGGFIIPGPRLMREVLQASTDRVRFDDESAEPSLGFGLGTASCVLNGALLAVVGAVQRAVQCSEQLVGMAADVYLTGGDAERLIRLPELKGANFRPDLVLDGLCCVLP